MGFSGDSDGKESTFNAGDPGSIPGREDPLEKGMAAHSSILAWRIPWTEEPGGLQSMWNEKSMQDEDRIQVNCRTQSCNSFFLVTSVNFSSTFITA